MKKLFSILIIMTAVTLSAQEPRQWQKRYNGSANGDDYSKSMAVDIDGNIYVCGESYGNDTSLDFTTIKYDVHGDTIWVRRYNVIGSSNDYAYGISTDISCNVFITGESDEGVTTLKYDSLGNFKWKRSYNVMNAIMSYGAAVSNDNAGNVIVLGAIWGFVDNAGYVTIKYDTEGNTIWLKHFSNGDIGGFPTAVAIDLSGNIIITGAMHFANDEFLTVKYNSNGDTIWTRRYSTPGYYSHASAVAVDNSGNVFVTGQTGGSPFAFWLYKYLTIKYDVNGNTLWERKYDGLGNERDYATAICTDKYGNAYVTGESSGPGNNYDYATIKYNALGDSLWVRRYNGYGTGDDKATSMCLDREGNVYVTGSSYGHRTQSDFATIKYDPSGTQKWVMRYDGPVNSNDGASTIKTDLNGNIYVTGTSRGLTTGLDFLTLKYSPLISEINLFTKVNSKAYNLYQNYPNPFNPITKIRFELPRGAVTKLKVYDILGKEIVTLIDEYKESGTYDVDFNGSSLSSGTYFYELTAGDFTEIKKMTFIK